MKNLNFHYFPRDFEAGNLIEYFLASAVVNVLFWRFYLHFTGYPKIIFGDYYFPHVLTGGVLMTIALLMLISFINREIKYISAVIGGAGFGLFIDEIGKLITQDNNYLYKPTIAIIYVIFILLFLISRAAEKFFKPSAEEYGINALEIAKNVIMRKFQSNDKQLVISLIDKSDINNPIIKMLKVALTEVRAGTKPRPNLIHRTASNLKKYYKNMVAHVLFTQITIWIFVVISIINFAGAAYNFKNAQSFSQWGELIFSLISGLIVFIGAQVLIYKVSRMFAYELFKLAVLISIFLTQFFRFLNDQFSAITVLLLYLIVLSVLQYLIYEESLVDKSE